jgi:L-alanine-DL-glutamate epimerase-like enolase superfamily enzyme
MPKDDPTWTFARGNHPVVDGWLIRLAGANGKQGLGYSSTSAHLGVTKEGVKAAFEAAAPKLIGRSCFDLVAIATEVEAVAPDNAPLQAGIDCALHELSALTLDLPLCDLFGGRMRTEVPVLRTMAIKTPKAMAEQAQKLVDEGNRYLKIKIHGVMKDDLACVEAIRRQVGPAIHLTADANQTYKPDAAIESLTRMADFGVELVEQPVSVDDREGLKRVTEAVPFIVEADEGACSLTDILELASQHIVGSVALKIPQLGGLRNTLAAARICEAAGIKYRMGGAVGPRLLTAQAMHLCAAFPALGYACEFGEFVRLLEDPTEGIEITDGMMRLPEGSGSGVTLRA